MDSKRWLIAGVIVALLVGLLAFARGAANHHGQQVGVRTIGSAAVVSASATG